MMKTFSIAERVFFLKKYRLIIFFAYYFQPDQLSTEETDNDNIRQDVSLTSIVSWG